MKKKIIKGKKHQKLLRDIIFFMLETEERREAINNGYADFNYNFTNILAKYYNANDSCRISEKSFDELKKAEVTIPESINDSSYSRETFRGSAVYTGNKNFEEQTPLQRVKGKFMFDHNPPVNIIRKKILEVNENKFNEDKTIEILKKYNDCVFMLTRNEDKLLKETKTIIDNKEVSLNANMPSEWKWEDKNANSRYNKCSIQISGRKMRFNTNKIPR